ncbi:ferric-dicitrate binding protein FerR (iron transport regulator) [Filimonas zeae]|uniref:Iron dicitrate transporter FecR n=1 Tax=Filimonas zeae TaxID=1737353 RepID=A0A917IPB9_9BACT|nr:FecR family protein [Filimonas zeae]MDR6337711.1 ferric-dicitrate binding protein FerR (iron transport regulator) [Filimonas zeae]GGH59895.1 iron dicitrate transporter FecR [Filimonas zeae]
MEYSKDHIQHLWELYIANKASKAEVKQLFDYIADVSNDEENQAVSARIISSLPDNSPEKREPMGEVWQSIVLENNLVVSDPVSRDTLPEKKSPGVYIGWWRYAAAGVFVLLVGMYLLYQRTNTETKGLADTSAAVNKAVAGHNGAVLTLGDGRQIELDSSTDGLIDVQSGTKALLSKGQLQYNGKEGSGEVTFNTLTTPRGRQFKVLLPDGTGVWLNAASSIRFPTLFNSKVRNVEISGEAYLDVAHNSDAPFQVAVRDKAIIEVLGTDFNINAYENEPDIKTTLVAGAIRLLHGPSVTTKSTQPVLLKPGEQAKLTGDKFQVTKNADINNVLAWRNGLFNFDNLTLKEILQQLERWYDVEIVCQGDMNIKFEGLISRELDLTGVLKALAQTEKRMHYEVTGKKVTITIQ